MVNSGSNASPANRDSNTQAVSSENGKQIVTLRTKGGYSPASTKAKADQLTTLRFVTQSSFDCSTALTIPSLKISKNLPNTGTTDIEISAQKPGTNLLITCSMGMYSSRVLFE